MKRCSNYTKIKEKILEETKKYKYCYLQGPKGDRGEAGPATIKVGITETVDSSSLAEVINDGTNNDLVLHFKIPKGMNGLQGAKGEKGDAGPATIQIGNVITIDAGEEAEVYNTGTPENVVLEFKIPKGVKGDKGEKGDIGPRGLPGEIGRTEHINVELTETVDPTEEAQVLDTFENNVHNLSFYIPKGDTGATGPAGPAGESFVSAYGLKYSSTDGQISVLQGTDSVIPLELTGPAFFTEYEGNAIKIKENGFYLVSYLLCGGVSENCSLTLSVKANDVLQAASNVTSEFQANVINSISGSTIVALNPTDLVTLQIKSSRAVDLIFNGSTGAMLSVLKIH